MKKTSAANEATPCERWKTWAATARRHPPDLLDAHVDWREERHMKMTAATKRPFGDEEKWHEWAESQSRRVRQDSLLVDESIAPDVLRHMEQLTI